MKLRAAIIASVLLLSTAAPAVAGDGFDQYGYNRTAHNFVGTGGSWCQAKGISDADCLANYVWSLSDKLVMKWNAEWDRGNAEGWANGPYRAYLDNEWNGNVPGGSGYTEHFKAVWIGPCVEGATLENGGYCLWGQFEAIFDRGMDPSHSRWINALASPAGYGSYP